MVNRLSGCLCPSFLENIHETTMCLKMSYYTYLQNILTTGVTSKRITILPHGLIKRTLFLRLFYTQKSYQNACKQAPVQLANCRTFTMNNLLKIQ
jgi:hypothetical protein